MTRNQRVGFGFICAAVALAFSAAGAQAANDAYLQLTGAVQGNILGSSTVGSLGRTAKIVVNEVHHLGHVEPGNTRVVHEPFIITKSVDRSSVNLYRAMDTSESLTAVLRFYKPTQTGQEINYYTITLTNARVVAVEPIMADNLDSSLANLPVRERVRFSYGSIIISYNDEDNETYELIAN